QDSMEFIEYLLDGLKEDVNRVKGQKPFVETKEAEGRPDDVVAAEARENYRQRNNSHIDDMFLGFFKSTGHHLPGAGVRARVRDVRPVPLGEVVAGQRLGGAHRELPRARRAHDGLPQLRMAQGLGREVRRRSGEIIRNAAASANLDAKNCVLAEIITFEKIYKFFEPSDAVDKIGSSDVLVMYELENEFHIPYEERWGRQDDAQADGASQDGEKCSVVIPAADEGFAELLELLVLPGVRGHPSGDVREEADHRRGPV
ncbi:unnamed protein product, partial [Prorocentrum cordatum]